MPDRTYDVAARVAAGRALDRLGVDAVQAGFPAVGETDRAAVRRLAGDESVRADVVALARARADDVDAALEAEADVVDVMVPTSDRQLEHVLGASRAAATTMAGEALDRARDGGAAVHLTLVDGFRTDPDALAAAFSAVPRVPTITVADTVGARTPEGVRSVVDGLRERGVDADRLGVHFHDDLGVATANTLAAVRAGATSADVSVAALGERAGNAALERVVVADAVGDEGSASAVGVDRSALIPACREVLDALGESVDPRTPVLGEAVTTHESGIHTAAMLRDPAAFEPFDPETFGGERRLVFGAGSGRGSARALLERAGVDPTEERVSRLLDLLAERGPVDAATATALIRERF
jgi:isopropylmalate/homocitrate/citramalate synthase